MRVRLVPPSPLTAPRGLPLLIDGLTLTLVLGTGLVSDPPQRNRTGACSRRSSRARKGLTVRTSTIY